MTSYVYQWARDGSNIPGATAFIYVPVAADVGHGLTVAVIATNSGGPSIQAISTAISVLDRTMVNVTPPQIYGAMRVGNRLMAEPGTFTNSPTSFVFQWTRDGIDIAGATASIYKITQADAGHLLQITIIPSNAAGKGAPVRATQRVPL